MPLLGHRRKCARRLFSLVEYLCFCLWPIRTVPRPLLVDSRTSHQLFDRVNRLGTVIDGLVMFAAEDDCFFRTRIHAEAAVDAAHHIDIEPERKFFDLRIGMLTGF